MSRVWPRLAAAVGLLAALSTFSIVVSGRDWWLPVAAVVIAIGLLGTVVRPVILRLLLHIGVLLGGLALHTSPNQWGGTAREAASIIWVEAPPVAPAIPIVAVMIAGFGLVALLLDLMMDTRWGPWWLALSFVSIVAIPTALMGVSPPVWLLSVMAAAWLVVLALHGGPEERIDWRHVTVATVGVTVLSALLFPSLPGSQARVWNVGNVGPGAFGLGVNPMLELGQDLQRGPDRPVLEYTSTRTTSSYLKLATLSDFSGQTWEPREFPTANAWRGEIGDAASNSHSLEVRMLELESRRIPIPARSTTIAGLAEWWTWMRPGGTAQLASGSVQGQEFRVDFEVPDVSLEQMRAATTRERVDVAMVRLPRSTALPAIESLAQEVTADAGTDYDRAVALQDWFRSEFEYSETTPVTEDYNGNGFEHVMAFLRERSGYCIHFASSMAIMGRTIGLPTRVAVGYAPADSMVVRDGARTWVNRSHDAHAWVEVHFDEIGWVAFDPTPSIGTATSFTSEQEDSPEPQTPEDTPATEAPDEPTPEDVEEPDTAVDDAEESDANSWWWLGVLVLVGAVPALARMVRRGVRGSAAVDVWREVTDTAVDLGIAIRPSLTVGETIDLLVSRGAPRDETERLAAAVDRSRYGDDETSGEFSIRPIRRGLRAAASRGDRLVATIAPRSLLRWRSAAPVR